MSGLPAEPPPPTGRPTDKAAALPELDVDDLLRRSEDYRLPLSTWTVPFLALLAVAAIMLMVTSWLDFGGSNAQGGGGGIASLFHAAFNQDLEQARQTVGGLGEVMAAVLGLALTVSSIIVQLAATRFTPHVTSLFFRARTNVVINGFFVVSTIFVLWINYSAGNTYIPRFGVIGAMLLMTASLLLLFPYFAYVFSFLEPDSIVGRITTDGLKAATPIRGPARLAIHERQRRSIESVENLANIALNAIQQKDKNIASLAANALCTFGSLYGDTKVSLPKAWHGIPRWNRQSPDFVSLSDEAVRDIEQRETWLEWKILRQYQMLFTEGLLHMKDLCYLIAINTRRLGEAAARRSDMLALDLSIKFFNTYLRATINANDIRTAYNILHQYRQLGEALLNESAKRHEEGSADAELVESRGVEITRFMRYYSGIAFGRGMSFITEVIAYDVGTLTELAFHLGNPCHRDLLQTFLRVDDTAETSVQEKTLRGVRRAQVKLGATYLAYGRPDLADEVANDMREEPVHRLRSIWQELMALDAREFWEVNDRGTNFDYLTPDQKSQLPSFFGRFPGLEGGLDLSDTPPVS